MHSDSTPEIPYGYCQCGCGQRTRIAEHNNRFHGRIKGQPLRFINGHNNRKPKTLTPDDLARFWSSVDTSGGDDACWPWIGSYTSNGYGRFHKNKKYILTHRLAYELLVGPIPEGLDIDHLCRNRSCVNPAHLEPVTHRENSLRGKNPNILAYLSNVCMRGHPRTEENTRVYKSGRRYCRICNLEYSRVYEIEHRLERRARSRELYHMKKKQQAA